ncbi:hypothetical protein PFDSM3638_03315 [Pyrococcus furiosus DSM 3638]|uniref:Uncharacterized protein n=3 Tax=Pyrococcus furiosus TaxID=2261 RepID=A0A5C0XND4_PYRFU|nr:hypothetical protein [Pyrococcus furiosus]AAL80787.1 hypothetical protein PF0663 [Pyrococcus furiosus DSM 3638]AFN03456.1 hypothetical protein PFC_02470 [Pyrococcus furiosus COM1]QEK78363.1 hypothetical protein PFDSM3638_03315 [Pyrococcus furiosus DSM 3638]
MRIPKRYVFWFILGSLSTLFGEVAIGATLYPFFSLWGIIVILPLYGLHTLVLSSIVYRFGRPRFETLYLAGVIFGLYEAYITKIIWNPDWESPIQVGGISALELLVVVFFWHPFMSFIIPIGVAELLTSRRKLLPEFILKHPALFAIVLGALESSNSPSPLHSFLSLASTLVIVLLLVRWWMTGYEGENLDDLLPTLGELRVLIPFLLVYYIALSLGIKREAIPGLGPQAFVWFLYALTFYLLYRALKKSRGVEVERTAAPSLRKLVVLSVVWIISGVVFSTLELFIHELKFAIIAILWLSGAVVGLVSFFRSARWALAE